MVKPSDTGSAPAGPQASGPTLVSAFQPRAEILDANGVSRAIRRIAHEILERNDGTTAIVLLGLQKGGVALANQLAIEITAIDGEDIPVGTLDVGMYRDDASLRPLHIESETDVPVNLDDKVVVLVDDVLFTGRTVRAALDALRDHGRPASVQLAVMVDRGHRELPIRPDFVGKNLPTSRSELVVANLDGVSIGTVVTMGYSE